MKLFGRDLDKDVCVVAEIGNNHEGSLTRARELVHAAKKAGVDAVKFQTFITENFVSPLQTERFKRLKSFELSNEAFLELFELAHSLGLGYFSSAFDLGSLDFIGRNAEAIKIASGDNNFYPLLNAAAAYGKPILMSTGMATYSEIESAVEMIRQSTPKSSPLALIVLHCVSAYPAPDGELNLRAIPILKDKLNVPVGFSDHSSGIMAATLASALGACVIEKHFTLDKQLSSFRDHALSADPKEMTDLVKNVRRVQTLIGSGAEGPQPSEKGIMREAHRSICAARDLPQGHVLVNDDLIWLRPADGLSPGKENLLVGRRLLRPIRRAHKILESDVG